MPKLYPYTAPTREEFMVAQYGECVKQVDAAKMLGRSDTTIRTMVRDGRLEGVCKGKMVSVRSIAQYMDAPAAENFKARQRKKGRKPGTCIVPSTKVAP